ncbi:hypothetical protein ACS7JX_19080 [Rhodococcus erythropolis]
MSKTESFSFLNELALAFRAAENHPRPQYAPVLEGIRAVLAHLQSTGRLIPAGGMALTAERVEDVRLLLGKATTEYGAMELTAAWARLRALLPATEPAEEETKADRWTVSTTYRAAGPSETSDDKARIDRFADAWRASGYEVTVTPVAEGEERTCTQCPDYAHGGDGCDLNPSPVVPIPTETGPWQRIEDVPVGVLQIKDRHGRTWLMVGGTWRFEWHDGNWYEPHTNINAQAPFVAAEEG